MDDRMDVDLPLLPEWNTASVSFSHKVSHVVDIPNLWDAYNVNLGDPIECEAPLKDVHLEGDICPPAAAMHESCREFAKRQLAEVGRWTTADGRWTTHLVLAGHDHDRPFLGYDDPELVLFVRLNIPSSKDNSPVIKVISDVELSLREPMSVKTEKGFEVETKVLGGAKELKFDDEACVRVIKLYSKEFKRVLKLWATNFLHPFCHLEINIISTMAIKRKFEMTGIGRILHGQKDLINLITDNMTLKDVASLRGVCSTTRAKVIGVPERRLRLAIEPYFSGMVSEFCAALRAHGAAIGGSTALSVLCPGKWSPNDLDLVVPSRFFHRFTEYLGTQGYVEDEEVPNGGKPYEEVEMGDGNMSTMVEYEYHCFVKGDRKIDLSNVLHGYSPAMFILMYHSTAVMNFFAGSRIFCCFPDLTFDYKNLKNDLPDSERLARALEKIQERGFRFAKVKGHKDVQGYLGIQKHEFPCFNDLPSVWYQEVDL